MPKSQPSQSKDLSSYDLDKWLALAGFIIERNDGRDRLCYEILQRALVELRWRRRVSLFIDLELKDLRSNLSRLSKTAISTHLKELMERARSRAEVTPIVQAMKQWNPATAIELTRTGAIDAVNDQILKPRKFVLVLHYKSRDFDKQVPIDATFERWEL